jgi:hypothetical protein
LGSGGGRRLIFQQVSGKQKQKQKNWQKLKLENLSPLASCSATWPVLSITKRFNLKPQKTDFFHFFAWYVLYWISIAIGSSTSRSIFLLWKCFLGSRRIYASRTRTRETMLGGRLKKYCLSPRHFWQGTTLTAIPWKQTYCKFVQTFNLSQEFSLSGSGVKSK